MSKSDRQSPNPDKPEPKRCLSGKFLHKRQRVHWLGPKGRGDSNHLSPLRVTVFGGSIPKPDEPAYLQAYQLGELLGSSGWTVLTGGYIGTMEAISRGAYENGSHVIGVTCDEIEKWRNVAPNSWVKEKMRFPYLRQRLYALIENCDAAIVLPGGIGTLAEIAVMWSQLQTGASFQRPLILIGFGWKDTFERFYEVLGEYISSYDRDLITFASDGEHAVSLLKKYFSDKDQDLVLP